MLISNDIKNIAHHIIFINNDILINTFSHYIIVISNEIYIYSIIPFYIFN